MDGRSKKRIGVFYFFILFLLLRRGPRVYGFPVEDFFFSLLMDVNVSPTLTAGSRVASAM